jgi:DNA-directed RNA polymerase II subunit RPB1
MPIETYAYTADIVQIDKIEFCVFGNDEVKRYSVINDQLGINIPEAYDNGEPKQGGLIDKRLGVSDYHIVCDTCGLTTNDCPGHFGHIELAEEVFHYGYLDTVKNILNCICLNCSKLLISKNRDEMMEIVDNSIGKIRFAKIKKLTSNVKFCQYPDNGCGKPVAKISKAGPLQLMATYVSDAKQEDGNGQASTGLKKKKNTEILTPSRVYNILKNIDDMDCRLMGFDPKKNRPEYFIIKYFPVPPVAIRPSVRLESSAGPSGDSLTSKLADIVKDNIKLRKQKDRSLITGEESKYNQDYLQVLQYDIATYYDNDSTLPKSDQKGGKSFKSISERLEGKTGRIRGNLMGKRVDFSARTVITSDPNISLDELGVPIKIVTNITFPEIVTPFNIDKLSKLVRNGRDIYPGANFVYPLQSLESGKKSKIDLRYRKKSVKLHYGDIVERHIIDGDPVLFNRQPTLHKMSMMCHKVKVIMDESLYTFRLNVSVTTPYNADFDGDEMNMFIPQTIQTQLELSNIADVKKMIIGPRLSIPIIKFVQDTLLGSYRMTDAIRTLDYHDAMNLAMYCKNVDIFKLRKETINTHNLYSLIIPDMINYSSGKANITNGNLINGTVDKSIINDKIVYYTWDRHGHEITRNFFDNSQRLVTNWFLINGSTVGYGDAIIEKNVSDDVASIFETKKMEVDTLITEMENNPDMLNPELFENKIKSKLESSVGEITTKVYDHLKKNNPDNNFYLMVESGAKGSKGNVSRIIGGTCQSILEFSRIKKKVNNRTLPHFFQNDDRAVARGYSTSSFYTGLDPKEFFFLHMAGRSGLIDTAIKTADSGYISRKMIKGMEDVHLTYDKTVRSGNNVIIQMLYGDNNIGQVHYKENEIKIVNMSNTDINNKFGFSDEETKKMIKEFKLNKSEFDKFNGDYCSYICNLRDELRDIQMKVRFDKITMMDKYMLPVNLSRIVNDAKNISDKSKSESLNPYYVSHVIKQILRPSITNINLMDENSNGFKYNDQDRGKYLFKIALYEYLSPKRCIFEYKLSKYQFDQMIIEILKSFKKACVEPGEMVGVLTAQTLGEISTQMSLHANSTIFLKAENKSTRKTKIIRTKIGKFIELLYKKFPDRIKNIPGHNDSTEFSLDNFTYDYCICGVSQDEKVRWNKISHLSKHPTNGNLLKIKTLSGRTVISTKSHNFLKRTANDGIIAVTSDNLKISDRIPVARKIEYKSNNEEFDINGQVLKLNEETALSFGLQSDDYLNNDIFFEFVHNANLKFVSTLLRTYFDNNSDIILDQNIIRVYFKSTELMKCISMLLPYFGIFGTIYEESCTIEISHEYVKIFLECIGTDIQQKREDMEKIGIFSDSKCEYDKIPELGHIIARLGNDLRLSDNLDTYEPIERHTLVKYIEIFYDKYNEIQSTLDPNMRQNIKSDIDYLKMISLGDVIWDEIVEITEMDDPKEYVYDFTIPGNETFMVNEGILVHNTLNTFHQAGTGVVGMRGIPRFKEIISYTKKMQTPSMMIKLTPEVRSNQVIAHKIEASLRHTIFGNIIDKMDIIYDPFVTMPEKDGLDRKNIYYTHTSNISLENLPWLYRFTFNRDSLLEYDVKLLDIKTKLIKYWTEYLSDTNIAKKKLIVSKVINGCIMSNYDNSENPIIHIRYDVFNPDNNSLIDIGQYMINKISIKGVEAIQSVDSLDKKKVIEYDEDQGIKSNTYEWIIYTNGIDLNKAKTIKYIDFNSTYINDIYMSYLNFGIEAARSSIIRECDDLFSSGGNPINITHISFLADVMTNTGNITSIDRHGLNRLDTDPLSRASFENTVTQLINAAAFNEVDHVRSVSSRIMAGRCIKGGTGLCDVLMDNDIIENSEFTKQTKTYSKDIKIQVEENRLIKHMLSKNFVEPDIYIP